MDNDNTFRQWKLKAWFLAWLPGEAGRQLSQELHHRKIDRRNGPNKLRWGYRPTRTFSVNEATGMTSSATNLPLEK